MDYLPNDERLRFDLLKWAVESGWANNTDEAEKLVGVWANLMRGGAARPQPPAETMTHGEKLNAALLPTRVVMDHRVQSVLAYMQQTLQADDLRGVAEAVATLAPAVWGHFRYEPVVGLGVRGDIGR